MRSPEETVEHQQADGSSWLNQHRRLLAVRKAHPDLWQAAPEWGASPAGAVRVLRRGNTLAATNLEPRPVRIALPGGPWRVVFDSRSALPGRRIGESLEVAAETSLLLARVD